MPDPGRINLDELTLDAIALVRELAVGSDLTEKETVVTGVSRSDHELGLRMVIDLELNWQTSRKIGKQSLLGSNQVSDTRALSS